MKTLFLSICLIGLLSCEEKEITVYSLSGSTDEIVGSWALANVFLGDVVDGPCAWNQNDKPRGINIKFELKDAKLVFDGRSVINQYGGTYEITDKQLKIKELITTEMAGSKEFMECEARYYRLLSEAKDFRIEQEGNTKYLSLGNFPPAGSPPSRGGGGTYLRFYKVD
jgi:heat shock protein HslJ